MVDEYEEIQRLRELWSKNMMTSRQVFMPLVFLILSLAISYLPSFIAIELGFMYLFMIWIILTLVLVYWYMTDRANDKDIAAMYPRLLELEKKHNMELHTEYYYRHLNNEAKKRLREFLNKPGDLEAFLNLSFRGLKELILGGNNRNHMLSLLQESLLKVWDEKEMKSMKTRGTSWQDVFRFFVIMIFFIIIVIGMAYGYW